MPIKTGSIVGTGTLKDVKNNVEINVSTSGIVNFLIGSNLLKNGYSHHIINPNIRN